MSLKNKFDFHFPMAKIISCILTDEGTIEIIKRAESNEILLSCPPQPAPDLVWKDIYGAVDGKIELIKTITGKHEPSYNVAEKITFEED